MILSKILRFPLHFSIRLKKNFHFTNPLLIFQRNSPVPRSAKLSLHRRSIRPLSIFSKSNNPIYIYIYIYIYTHAHTHTHTRARNSRLLRGIHELKKTARPALDFPFARLRVPRYNDTSSMRNVRARGVFSSEFYSDGYFVAITARAVNACFFAPSTYAISARSYARANERILASVCLFLDYLLLRGDRYTVLTVGLNCRSSRIWRKRDVQEIDTFGYIKELCFVSFLPN